VAVSNLSRTFLIGAALPLYTNPPNFSRIADGVVHFRVHVFDTNGVPFFYFNNAGPNLLSRTNIAGNPLRGTPVQNAYAVYNSLVQDPVPGFGLDFWFVSNAVPAFVELEIGFLEPHLVDRFKALAPNVPAQRNYLSNHVANVHLFRQRIPIRNVDYRAYQSP